jgi:hypothetical protein
MKIKLPRSLNIKHFFHMLSFPIAMMNEEKKKAIHNFREQIF